MIAKTYCVVFMLALGGILPTCSAYAQERGINSSWDRPQADKKVKGEKGFEIYPLGSILPLPATFETATPESFPPDTLAAPAPYPPLELVPLQFTLKQVLSVEEQRIQQEQKAHEALYHQQLAPDYFEKVREDFQKEYHRRMAEKKQADSLANEK